jgi:hypothetical protein
MEADMPYTLVYYDRYAETGRERFYDFDLAKTMAEEAVTTGVGERTEVLDANGMVRFGRPRAFRKA